MLPSVPQTPSHFRAVGFGPPAIKFGNIYTAVNQHLHAAGAAGFPRASGGVDPEVNPMRHLGGNGHVIILNKQYSSLYVRPGDVLNPLPDQGLAGLIIRVRLTRDDKLHRHPRPVQDTAQAVRIVEEQVGAFVAGETPGKSYCKSVGIQALIPAISVLSGNGLETADPRPTELYESKSVSGSELPQGFIINLVEITLKTLEWPEPPLFAARCCPEFVGLFGVPGGDMYTVCYVSHRNFRFRPSRKEFLENLSAHLPVQAAYPVYGAAAFKSKPGHVKRLMIIFRYNPSQTQKSVCGYSEGISIV